MAPIWGDADKGATLLQPSFAGHDAGTHTHTSDIWIVVVKAPICTRMKPVEKRVGPQFLAGSGEEALERSDPKEERFFYEEGSGKFDLIPVNRGISMPTQPKRRGHRPD